MDDTRTCENIKQKPVKNKYSTTFKLFCLLVVLSLLYLIISLPSTARSLRTYKFYEAEKQPIDVKKPPTPSIDYCPPFLNASTLKRAKLVSQEPDLSIDITDALNTWVEKYHLPAIKNPSLPSSKFLLYSNTHAGFGNNFEAFVSAFTVAVLTQRAFIIKPYDQAQFFIEVCTYIQDEFFSSNLEGVDYDRDYKATAGFLNNTYVTYLPFTQIDWHWVYYCNNAEVDLLSKKVIGMSGNQYILQGILAQPTMRKIFYDTFGTHKDVFHQITKKMLVPVPWIQKDIEEFKQEYFEKNYVIGIHFRTKEREIPEGYEKRFHKAARDITEKIEDSLPKGMRVKWFLASDSNKLKQKWEERYPDHAITFRKEYKQKHGGCAGAIVDLYLLSSSDTLLLTLWSTFGYAAQGMAGKIPFVMWDKCHRWYSAYPCYHECFNGYDHADGPCKERYNVNEMCLPCR